VGALGAPLRCARRLASPMGQATQQASMAQHVGQLRPCAAGHGPV
jgi:hypothetical protein